MSTCGPHAVDNYNQTWCGGTPVPASHLTSASSDRSEPLYPGHEDADPGRPLYPEVTVRLSGQDGNVGSIMARVRDAMRQAGVPDYATVVSTMWAEVFEAESYDESLRIVMRYVEVT